MTLDLTDLPVVDTHCHLFLPSLETESFDRYWTLSTLPVSTEDIRSTVLFQMMTARLVRFLGMPEAASFDEVAAERTARYRADPAAHVTALFADAGLRTLLIDIGYPSIEDEGLEIEPSDFTALVPRQNVRIIVRIEPIMYELVQQRLGFDEFVEAFRGELARSVVEHGAVALKSVIAYHTGLDIHPVPRERARRAYEAMAAGGDREARKELEKEYRDFALLEALEFALDQGLPMQLHTGMGDSPDIDVRLADPSHLHDLVADEHFARATIVLVHAGYPHHLAAGFMASAYPNVWIDLSEMVPMVGPGITARLVDLLDMTPLRKITYGSDGFNIPELSWFSAVQFRDSLAEALGTLVESKHVSAAFAETAARGILGENADRLYGLQEETGG